MLARVVVGVGDVLRQIGCEVIVKLGWAKAIAEDTPIEAWNVLPERPLAKDPDPVFYVVAEV